MSKKTMAIFLECIPIAAALFAVPMIFINTKEPIISRIAFWAVIVAFFGFAFFIVAMALGGREKVVKVLGFFDILSTLVIVVIYTLAIFSFGL